MTSTPPASTAAPTARRTYDYNTVVTLTPAAEPARPSPAGSGDADCADGSVTMTRQELHGDLHLGYAITLTVPRRARAAAP